MYFCTAYASTCLRIVRSCTERNGSSERRLVQYEAKYALPLNNVLINSKYINIFLIY